MPDITRKALKVLLETNSDDEYKERLKNEINELLDICTEIKLDISSNQSIKLYHY